MTAAPDQAAARRIFDDWAADRALPCRLFDGEAAVDFRGRGQNLHSGAGGGDEITLDDWPDPGEGPGLDVWGDGFGW